VTLRRVPRGALAGRCTDVAPFLLNKILRTESPLGPRWARNDRALPWQFSVPGHPGVSRG